MEKQFSEIKERDVVEMLVKYYLFPQASVLI